MWDIPPTLFAKAVTDDTDRLYRGFAITVFNNLTLLSPVDSGRYRANHIISIGQPDERYSENAGGYNLGINIVQGIEHGKFPTIWVQNNLPYALRIENGWSDQAPNGVYGLAFNSAKMSYGL